MWKCKKCGNNKFYDVFTEYDEVKYEKDGEKFETLDSHYEYEHIECSECENKGQEIRKIAFWEE